MTYFQNNQLGHRSRTVELANICVLLDMRSASYSMYVHSAVLSSAYISDLVRKRHWSHLCCHSVMGYFRLTAFSTRTDVPHFWRFVRGPCNKLCWRSNHAIGKPHTTKYVTYVLSEVDRSADLPGFTIRMVMRLLTEVSVFNDRSGKARGTLMKRAEALSVLCLCLTALIPVLFAIAGYSSCLSMGFQSGNSAVNNCLCVERGGKFSQSCRTCSGLGDSLRWRGVLYDVTTSEI